MDLHFTQDNIKEALCAFVNSKTGCNLNPECIESIKMHRKTRSTEEVGSITVRLKD